MYIKVKCLGLITEDVSTTGGNGGAITGGNVYSIGVNPGDKPTPRSSGDLVLSPIVTSPDNDDAPGGIPVKKHKHKQKHKDIKDNKAKQPKRIMNWDSYIRTKINNITYIN